MSDQVIIIGMQDKIMSDRKLIDVTAKGKEKWRLLSTSMVTNLWCYGSHSSVCMQNAWMYSLVYKEYDNGGQPTEEWHEYRDKGFRRKTAVFNLKVAEAGKQPLYVWFNNTRYELREARKHIYVPLYLRSIKGSQAMKELRKLYNDGHRMAIRDFGMSHETPPRTFEEALNDLNLPFSHAHIILHELTKHKEE